MVQFPAWFIGSKWPPWNSPIPAAANASRGIQKRVVGSDAGDAGTLVLVNKLLEMGVETVPLGDWRVNVYLEIVWLGNPMVKMGESPRLIKMALFRD